MTRRVFASSVDGQRLAQLAEEIAQAVNPHCWFNLKDISKLDPTYWDILEALLVAQGALIANPIALEQFVELGVG